MKGLVPPNQGITNGARQRSMWGQCFCDWFHPASYTRTGKFQLVLTTMHLVMTLVSYFFFYISHSFLCFYSLLLCVMLSRKRVVL